MQPVFIAPAAVLAALWLWFLARGKAGGVLKRIALRATLFAVAVGLVTVATQRGVFSRASFGFRLALLLAIAVVTVGYLYLTRFCDRCGRMVRNLKIAQCPRCGAALPVHGMTVRLRRLDEERPGRVPDRRERPPRARHPEGPSA